MIEDAEDLCLFRDIVNEVISDTNPIQVEYENEDANNKKEKENVNTISTLGKNASKDGDSGSEMNTSQDSTNHNIQNTDKQQNDKEGGINWVIIISIISSIIVMIIVSGFILKRFSKDK